MHLTRVTLCPENFPTQSEYPFDLELFQKTREISLTSPITFFAGENGTGKSSLLEAIAHRCRIYIWAGIQRTRYITNPYEKILHEFIDVDWANGTVPGSFFGSDIFLNFSQILDEWASMDPGVLEYFGGESLMTQSHGQSHMSFFRTRFKLKGLYLLDEPENALSPRSQLQLVKILEECARSGAAQFIVATHSPILLSCDGADILDFNHVPLSTISYRDTDHYRVYRDFLKSVEEANCE